MAPEFLYRGKGGAYIHDLINGWMKRPPDEFNLNESDRFPGLFGYLKSFLVRQSVHLSQQLREMGDGLWIQLKWEKYNTALIQRGGELNTADAYASRKRYISGIDFIKSQYNAEWFALGGVVPADRLNLEPHESNREGSATFTINGITIKMGNPLCLVLKCVWIMQSQHLEILSRILIRISGDAYVQLING
jgi:hypothetical protein